jgi:hypothetical protein
MSIWRHDDITVCLSHPKFSRQAPAAAQIKGSAFCVMDVIMVSSLFGLLAWW